MIDSEDNGILKSTYLNRPKPFGGKLYYLNSQKMIYTDLHKTVFKRYISSMVQLN